MICFFLFFTKLIENHKILDPQNTHERKSRTHETPTRKNLDPENTREKKFGPTKYPRKTHEIHGI